MGLSRYKLLLRELFLVAGFSSNNQGNRTKIRQCAPTAWKRRLGTLGFNCSAQLKCPQTLETRLKILVRLPCFA